MTPQRLGQRDIHVWHIDLTLSGAGLHESRRILSPAERERAASYVFPRDQRRFTVTHAAGRRILAAYIDRQPEEIEFEASEYGKPRLRSNNDIRFNLSHSEELAICAVARTEVGVDVEFLRARRELMQIAETCFSGAEVRALRQIPRSRRTHAFYRCWTRKEAYVKARGEGLMIALPSFTVSLDGRPRIDFSEHGDADQWRIEDVRTRQGYMAALAVQKDTSGR